MSSNKCVIVLTPNGRRQNVKVTPNTTILQVLEEVCKKHDFRPEEYDIKHHKHVLDAMTTIRFSGLPNNAQLEMTAVQKIREETNVVLGLQLESGDRLMDSFKPTNSLWEVIEKLCPDEADPNSNPVVIYMRKEVFGKKALEETTLRSLGLTGGRAMLRFFHRTPEELHQQASVSAPLHQRMVEKISKEPSPKIISSENPSDIKSSQSDLNLNLETQTADGLSVPQSFESTRNSALESSFDSKTAVGDANNDPDCSKSVTPPSLQTTEKMDVDSNDLDSSQYSMEISSGNTNSETSIATEPEQEEPKEEILFLGERNAVAFSLEMAQSVPSEDLPDDFFELTLDDARACLRDLKNRRSEMEELPLITSAQRDLEESKRVLRQLNEYRRAVIRIQFPGRTVLQGTFLPHETVSVVMNFVRQYLANPETDFYLYTTPPINILEPETRLVDAECVPSAMVYFGTKDPLASSSKTYLREDILNHFTSPSAAALAACQSRGILPQVRRGSAPTQENPNRSEKITHQDTKDTKQERSTVNKGASTSRQSAQDGGPSNKVPKWFKPIK